MRFATSLWQWLSRLNHHLKDLPREKDHPANNARSQHLVGVIQSSGTCYMFAHFFCVVLMTASQHPLLHVHFDFYLYSCVMIIYFSVCSTLFWYIFWSRYSDFIRVHLFVYLYFVSSINAAGISMNGMGTGNCFLFMISTSTFASNYI